MKYFIVKIDDKYRYIKASDFYSAIDFIKSYFEIDNVTQNENFYSIDFEDIPLKEIIINVQHI